METKAIILGAIVIAVIVILIGSVFWITRNDKKKPTNSSSGGTIGDNFTQKPQE